MKKTDLAFTRIELLFCLLGITLLGLPALSLLASNKSESQRIVCFNNLRQIGRAFQAFANEHNDMFAWRIAQADGGSRGSSFERNLWFQYTTISNQLESPRVLVCPADASTPKMAQTWGNAPGGFLSVKYENYAVSYIIGLHALAVRGTSLLSADENIRFSGIGGCGVLQLSAAVPGFFASDSAIRWTNAVHGTSGHLLFGDGSVQFTSSAELRDAASKCTADESSVHYLTK